MNMCYTNTQACRRNDLPNTVTSAQSNIKLFPAPPQDLPFRRSFPDIIVTLEWTLQ